MQRRAKNIRPKAVRELLADEGWRLDSSLLEKTEYIEGTIGAIYRHSDNRILAVWAKFKPGYADLYSSLTSYLAFMEEMKQAKHEALHGSGPRHILDNVQLYGEDFPLHVGEFVEDLSRRLKIPIELLDFSPVSLFRLDDGIRRYGKRKSLESPVFAGLIAYTSEYVRRVWNGQWKIQRSPQKSDIWEPWIVLPNGRIEQVFSYVYEELAENSPFSMASVVILSIPFVERLKIHEAEKVYTAERQARKSAK